jgi:1-deoxy-D-xylulose-5-phosphate synthase
MIVSAPRDGNELRDLLWTGLSQGEAPFALRYPRDTVPAGYDAGRAPRLLPIGSWERLEEGSDVCFLAVGTMVETARAARTRLAAHGVSAAVVNCRFVKPLDVEMLEALRSEFPVLVTVEENSVLGGFGDGVLESLAGRGRSLERIVRLGLPDAFVTHGTREELLEEVGLTPGHLASAALGALGAVPS